MTVTGRRQSHARSLPVNNDWVHVAGVLIMAIAHYINEDSFEGILNVVQPRITRISTTMTTIILVDNAGESSERISFQDPTKVLQTACNLSLQ